MFQSEVLKAASCHRKKPAMLPSSEYSVMYTIYPKDYHLKKDDVIVGDMDLNM